MTEVYVLAIDLAKRSVQVCATDSAGAVLCNHTMSRAKLEQLLSEEASCIVSLEACATGHFSGNAASGVGWNATA